MKLYTARINYRPQTGETVLNTTVKSGAGLGLLFAPTWEMVMASKRGQIDWPEYTARYYARMRESYQAHRGAWLEVVGLPCVVVTCYCGEPIHCHRSLLVDILGKVAEAQGLEFVYEGEK